MTATGGADPVVRHDVPSRRSVVLDRLSRLFLKPIYRMWPLGDTGVRALRIVEAACNRMPRPTIVEQQPAELGGVPAEVSVPRDAATDGLAGTRVLFLHGGAFLFCGTATHRRICGRLAQTLRVPIYSVRYRQLPEAGVGTSVQDAYDAYRSLLTLDPETGADVGGVVVAGDSAGGFLAAKICELAVRDGIAAPAAFVGYSPQLSLDVDRHDPALLSHDAYMPLSAIVRAKALWDHGPVRLRGTRSPVDAPAEVFPPTFLTAAADEMLEIDVRGLTDSLYEAGRPVETHLWRRQVHAFPVLDSLLAESREAITLTGEFLRRVLSSNHANAE